MEKAKIERLKKKQLELQEKIRLEKLCETISDSIDYLNSNNFKHKLHYKNENLNWIVNNVKNRKKDGYNGIHGDFQIDVDNSSIKTVYHLVSENDFLKIKPIINFINQIPNDSNLIVCSLTAAPELEITKNTFLTKPSAFFPTPETWIIDENKSILIENIWDQNIVRFINIEIIERPILQFKATIE
ncbi:MAG: hypothetical protein ACPGLV_15410 [Bacteroidia bacterium]